MIIVFIFLCISLICPEISKMVSVAGVGGDYVVYRIAKASIYLAPATAACYAGLFLLKNKLNFSCFLVCALAFCMTVTAMFNLVMINTSIYYTLNEIKSGPGFSWSSTYSSIEILIAITVGFNGLGYLAHMGDFTDRGIKAPVNPDLDHWTGKYK